MRSEPNTFVCGLISSFLAVQIGCHESVESMDEMEILPVKEALIEFSLGHHVVPIPVSLLGDGIQWTHGNAVYITFDLHAVIHSNDEEYIRGEWERLEGSFRDEVNVACRRATLDELAGEPDLTTLKDRLTGIAVRRFGKSRIRRLVLTEINLQPL